MEGRRICQVIELKQEHQEEYFELHRNTWPAVLEAIRKAHICDYSINFLPCPIYVPKSAPSESIAGLLMATFKYVGNDFDGDMKGMAEDEEVRKWWKLTDSMQKSLVDGATGSVDGLWWLDIDEKFHFGK
ncbi:hypothetical protein FRB94_010670 [Tulasnella sp. JGI-2019a]|nr:hypothetical protein FRB94_010670 [Tulasnella sp. JGI-2019a]KAG9011307.1 hypothetical protein FRB93_003109 [Tulasnella sp. JGI-2019a]KAG9037408.1 hypothetical protein FRB95_005697 [Tulasnella sp. JGI-2019a]